jgi:hypothetical protein
MIHDEFAFGQSLPVKNGVHFWYSFVLLLNLKLDVTTAPFWILKLFPRKQQKPHTNMYRK